MARIVTLCLFPRYLWALLCFGVSTSSAVYPQTKGKKEALGTPQAQQGSLQKTRPSNPLQGKAFEAIAYKTLPQHVIDYLLRTHGKKLFNKVILAEPYGSSRRDINRTLFLQLTLLSILIFGITMLFSLWSKLKEKGFLALNVIS